MEVIRKIIGHVSPHQSCHQPGAISHSPLILRNEKL